MDGLRKILGGLKGCHVVCDFSRIVVGKSYLRGEEFFGFSGEADDGEVVVNVDELGADLCVDDKVAGAAPS